jgi:hypothetical protein
MRTTLMIRHCTLAILAASALLAVVPSARAGTYTVYGCQTPSGSAAPLDGWHVALSSDSYFVGACPGPMFMGMEASRTHANGAANMFSFIAPSSTTVYSYTIRRAVRLVSGAGYYYQGWDQSAGQWRLVNGCAGPSGCNSLGDYTQPYSNSNSFFHKAETDTTEVQLKMLCGISSGCPVVSGRGADSVWFFQSAITLEDDYSPQFAGPPSGPLVTPGAVLSGVVPVTIGATDRGGGVYQALVEVDGQVIQSQVLDPNGGLCQQPFVVSVPCKLSASGTVSVDTRALSDGYHNVTLLVTDAAGNAAAYGPFTIQTDNNPCSPAPTAAGMNMQAAFAVDVRARVRVHRRWRTVKRTRFMSRLTTGFLQPPRVYGTLRTTSGAPVGAAAVCVAAQDNIPGAPIEPVGSLVTDANGNFSRQLGPGPSRTIYFIHRVLDGAIWTALPITVRVPVAVHVARHVLHNGDVMSWTGHLPGPVPKGLLALMQVWRGKYWQTFQQVAVGSRGNWTGRYRFEFTTGLQGYTFRLSVPRQSGYPYAANASSPIHITVTG